MVYVKDVDVYELIIASGVSIGDVHRLAPQAYVLAVQVEEPETLSDLYSFEDFPVFSKQPSTPLPSLNVNTFFYQNNPIYVNSIFVNSLSSAGVLQIGGTNHVDSLVRVKHIRILKENDKS